MGEPGAHAEGDGLELPVRTELIADTETVNFEIPEFIRTITKAYGDSGFQLIFNRVKFTIWQVEMKFISHE